MPNPTSVSAQCINLVSSSETLRLAAYLDPDNILTIGWGHVFLPKMDAAVFKLSVANLTRIISECQTQRRVTSECVQRLRINREQALTLLGHDIVISADCVHSLVSVPLNQNQFDALVSLTFNIGQGQFSHST